MAHEEFCEQNDLPGPGYYKTEVAINAGSHGVLTAVSSRSISKKGLGVGFTSQVIHQLRSVRQGDIASL
jgi:hypothetical protein